MNSLLYDKNFPNITKIYFLQNVEMNSNHFLKLQLGFYKCIRYLLIVRIFHYRVSSKIFSGVQRML